MSAEPLWQLSGVRFFGPPCNWPRGPFALAIPSGRTALLGLSGAGKTSLVKVLVGFSKPGDGSVRGPTRIAWAPQDHGLWHRHSVRENLTLVGASAAESDALLEEFDLVKVGQYSTGVLSLGEAARLCVARALAQKAPVVVMDEPLAHVDNARAGKYWRAIRGHIARTGASFVFATHTPEIALTEAEHAICMSEGSVVFTGKVADLYEYPESSEAANFLGPANWLTPDDARRWLGESWSSARCVRPERIAITPVENGAATVSASRFFGAFAETDLRAADGVMRTFLHRPSSACASGVRVSLAVVNGHPR